MKDGFSMLELLFALLVLQVGILATAGMVLHAQANLRQAEVMVRGLVEAEWIGDSLSAGPKGGTGRVSFPWGDVVWSSHAEVDGGWLVAAISAGSGDTLLSLPVVPALPRKPLFTDCAMGGPIRVESP